MKLFFQNNKLFCLSLAFMAILYLLAVRPYWKPTWDSAVYISLGESLVTGQGYSYMGVPHTKYPPLFPMLLSPVIAVFGFNYYIMRLLGAVLAIAAIGQCYFLIERCNQSSKLYKYFSLKSTCFGVMLLSGISYAMLYGTTNVLSDVPYTLFSLMALLYIEKYASEKIPDSRHFFSNKTAWITVVLIWVCFFTRLAGLTLVIAAVTYLLIGMVRNTGVKSTKESRKPYLHKILFLITLFSIACSAWSVRNKVHTSKLPAGLWDEVSYQTELFLVNPGASFSERIDLSELVKRVKQNFMYYEQLIGKIISGKKIDSPVGVRLIMVIIIIGFLLNVFFNLTILEVYLLYYASIYLLWPSLQGERFVVPVLPLLFYFILSFVNQILFCLVRVAGKIKDNVHIPKPLTGSALTSWPANLTVGFLFVLNISATADVIKEEQRIPYYQGPVSGYIDAIKWVSNYTLKESIVITDRAPWVYLLSGRKSYGFPWTGSSEAVINSIKKNRGTHIITVPWGYSKIYLNPVIISHPEKFREIKRVGGSVIYLVIN